MLWKCAKHLFSGRGSIATKLTFFYTVSTFVLITSISLVFYFTLHNILRSTENQLLRDEMQIIENILQKNQSDHLTALTQEIMTIPNALKNSLYHYYIRVVDSNQQKVLIETPGFSTLVPYQPHQTQFPLNENEYLSLHSQSPLLQISDTPLEVDIVLDISYVHKLLVQCKKMIVFLLIVTLFLSVVMGYFISRRGMFQLGKLTESTQKITAQALSDRLDPRLWPEELRELGTAYNQMLDRIEASLSRLNQFSDDLAHELRIPINNLMGQTELALSSPATSLEDYQNLCASNLEELNRLNKIIENLLFLARAEDPRMNLEKSWLKVHEEIEKLCEFYAAVAAEQEVDLVVKGEALLFANSIMFRRMMSNLLSNALHYAPAKTSIVIVIQETVEHIQISITDQGIGIAEQDLPKLFTRFYRVDSARSNYPGGCGLGLAIVKSIVDLHQGKICVQSKLQAGTTVTMTFEQMTTMS